MRRPRLPARRTRELLIEGGRLVVLLVEIGRQEGEVLLVTCPYEKGGHNIEVRTQVMRRIEMESTAKRIYGIRYEI